MSRLLRARRVAGAQDERGSAAVEFALLTTAVAAAAVGVGVALQAVAGDAFGSLLNTVAQLTGVHS